MQVGGQGPEADAPVKAAPGHVVQHRDAVGCVHRVVQGKHGDAGGEYDLLGQRQGLSDQKLRHRRVLPRFRDVFTDPSLVIAQLVGLDDQLHVPVVGVGEGPRGRMQRHHEQSKVHILTLLVGLRGLAIITDG